MDSAPLAMILTAIPFSRDLNLGAAYNATMELVPEDGWCAFLDHDAMFTTPQWHQQLEDAIAAEPRGSFTAVTNRIAAKTQQAPEADSKSNDITYHRAIGAKRLGNRHLLDITDAGAWGGVLMLVSKAAWRDAGGFSAGMFCTDHQFFYALREAGRRIYLIEGLYLYHFRGSSTDREMIRTAPKAKDRKTGGVCRCRTEPHVEPTVRRTL